MHPMCNLRFLALGKMKLGPFYGYNKQGARYGITLLTPRAFNIFGLILDPFHMVRNCESRRLPFQVSELELKCNVANT